MTMLKDAYAQVYLAQGEFAKAETSLNEAILWEAKATFAELGLKRLENEAVKNFKSLEDF